MAQVPCIIIVPEAQADKLSIVFQAMGRGPNSFTQGRKVCAKDPSATFETPPTHRLMQDMSATSELEAMWRLMAAGDAMPQVNWGDTPGITEGSAIAAAQSMSVFSVAGPMQTAWNAEAILAGQGLQFVPDPEI
ncbi:hypothetical protein [Pararhodobacter zhoushanensis]|uniref:Uncharacterized protein n=1 Tax=Pararhodobacter zhoushanensis TaxID=2479545 RepID=A0ABT3H3Y0_9RHOB|nr:hypothetical protein [Pararhodobacter zhoushanensis]MCW1934519.1 hypothetical protein [Pararhodobacter zhoushanensis]